MITFTKGDIFQDSAYYLVNPVNCFGVAGKGLALEFKKRFPKSYQEYHESCQYRQLKPGRISTLEGEENGHLILGFTTKFHWTQPSKLEWIDEGLERLVETLNVFGLGSLNCSKTVAIPALGCGLGGLNWDDVKPLMIKHLSDSQFDIRIYEPEG